MMPSQPDLIRTLDLTDSVADLRSVLPRAQMDVATAAAAVEPVMEQIKAQGHPALRRATAEFDNVDVPDPRVPEAALTAALEQLDPRVRDALVESIRRARIGHLAQFQQEVVTEVVPGGVLTQRWVPVRRVGLYVPGGLAVYPSSVVMNVVPAQVAQVDSIAVFSPPQAEFGSLPHPTILAACALLGVDEVYAAGGAQAIAAAAYGCAKSAGVQSIEAVDVVTGPGNIYVAAAKRILRGVVGIDAEAGPTEVAILADATANPRFIAADMISQAEHDPLAAAVLVTDSADLAAAVQLEVLAQTQRTEHSTRVRKALGGRQSAVVLVRDLEQGLSVVNAYAAEHLEVLTVDARVVAQRVRNAGAVFVGEHTPVSLGDYCAGSNHVLPTGGMARYAAGLSVQSFVKPMQVIEYSRDALTACSAAVVALAQAEDLPAHGAAVQVRVECE